jgi:ribonuclease E
MFNPTVQLPSGGYIVIGITEALVAIDINSGRATREGSVEETALKTNLEAAAEIARQLRLRDLAGLIVIDFIDMEERKNNAAVEKMLKDKLKSDRARIQVGRISGFGLLEMSRQRMRPGMLEATTQPCPHCHGTGLIRSDDSMGLTVLRQIEEEGTRGRSREVLVRAPAAVVNFIFNQKREHLAQIEARYGMAVRLEADPAMVSPDFEIERFKTATRVATPQSSVVSINAALMPDLEEDDIEVEEVSIVEETPEDAEEQPRKKRRRRRRRRGGKENGTENGGEHEAEADDEAEADADAQAEVTEEDVTADAPEAAPEPEPKPKRARRSRGKKPAAEAETETVTEDAPEAPVVEAAPEAEEIPAEAEAAPVEKPKRARRKTVKPAAPAPEEPVAEAPVEAEAAAPEPEVPAPVESSVPEPVSEEPSEEPVTEGEPEAMAPAESAPEDEAVPAEPRPEKKRRGWWALRGGAG